MATPQPSKPVTLIAQVGIPILTFLGGMWIQHAIASRTLSHQEFTTATTIATTEAAQKNQQLKEWAELVIAQYVAEKRKAPTPIRALEDAFIVSRAIADDVCIFPKQAFRDPYQDFIMKTVIEDPDKLVGQDARLLFFKAVSDYKMLRRQYEGAIDILTDSCGFLLKRESNTR